MSALSTAELAIFAILCLPVLYVLFKHGWVGFMGWLYLFIFCTLRIISGAMDLSGSKSASVISNIGLSPMILAIAGILHEVRRYANDRQNQKVEWLFYIAYHHFVIVGVILLAIGSSALQGGKPDPKDFTMVKAGISILTVSWVGLVACALLTLVMNRNTGASFALHSASQLLLSCTVALVFTGIRVIYSLVALVTQNPTLSPATGSLAVRVVLSFLPELISTLILLVGGILTRDIRKDAGPGPGQALPLKDTGRV